MFGRRNRQGEAAIGALEGLLATLRAQRSLYETLHWQAQGPTSYGDHLLFERLYDALSDEIDGVAEKLVGYAGNAAVGLGPQALFHKRQLDAWSGLAPFDAAIRSEQDVLERVTAVDQRVGALLSPVGLQDLLGRIGNKHLEHLYLLQQRQAAAVGRANRQKHPITIHSIGFPASWTDDQIAGWLDGHDLPRPIAVKRGSSRAKYAWARLQPVNRLLNRYRTGHWKTSSAGQLAVRWAVPRRRKNQQLPALSRAA